MSIDRDEFRDAMQRLYENNDAGFHAINARLDLLNGRVGKGEVDRENLRTRLAATEKEVFRRIAPSIERLTAAIGKVKDGGAEWKRRSVDVAGDGEKWSFAFTKNEYGLMLAGFAAVAAIAKVLGWALEKMWYLLAHAGVAG